LPELEPPLLITGAASRRRPPVALEPLVLEPLVVFDTGAVPCFTTDVPATAPPALLTEVRSRKRACCCTPIPGS